MSFPGPEEDLKRIDTLRPPCPTCGGTKMIACDGPPRCYGMHMGHHCPDCKDTPGKASIAWLVATFNAVHTPDWEDVDGTVHEVIGHLQSVRP